MEGVRKSLNDKKEDALGMALAPKEEKEIHRVENYQSASGLGRDLDKSPYDIFGVLLTKRNAFPF